METLMSAVVTSLVGGVASKLFADKPDTPPPPTVAPPVEMPDPLQNKAKARRNLAMRQAGQLTNASAVLTGGDSKLGA